MASNLRTDVLFLDMLLSYDPYNGDISSALCVLYVSPVTLSFIFRHNNMGARVQIVFIFITAIKVDYFC